MSFWGYLHSLGKQSRELRENDWEHWESCSDFSQGYLKGRWDNWLQGLLTPHLASLPLQQAASPKPKTLWEAIRLTDLLKTPERAETWMEIQFPNAMSSLPSAPDTSIPVSESIWHSTMGSAPPILGNQFRLRGRGSIVLLGSNVHSLAMILPWIIPRSIISSCLPCCTAVKTPPQNSVWPSEPEALPWLLPSTHVLWPGTS